jgi:uracil-DNA glycosylase
MNILNMEKILEKVNNERKIYNIYPPEKYVFRALTLCPVYMTKIVILGQDPYHGEGQANGLAFSVNDNVTIPPSLRNILKELYNDTGTKLTSGDLTNWASNGVLLLNTVLTVRESKANSHAGIIGWEDYTDDVIKQVNVSKSKVVFMLWGNHAKTKASLIDQSKHLVLTAAHPSPLSAHRGFFGCKHFSKANEFLNEKIF